MSLISPRTFNTFFYSIHLVPIILYILLDTQQHKNSYVSMNFYFVQWINVLVHVYLCICIIHRFDWTILEHSEQPQYAII